MKQVFYNDNPNMGEKVVTTVDGKSEYRSNCKKIKGEFYVMNKDCFEVSGVWYRLSSNLIECDHETGQYFLKKDMKPGLIKGVVGFKEGEPVQGWFTPNPCRNCHVNFTGRTDDRSSTTALSEELLVANGYAENLSNGIYYNTKHVSAARLRQIVNVVDHTRQGYNIEDNANEYATKCRVHGAYEAPVTPQVKAMAKLLGPTSFGAENECGKGMLPDHLQHRLGVVICRDGSLNDENGRPGPEFVTIPLAGPKGLITLKHLGEELSKRSTVNIKCSYHLHLGNLPRTREYLVALFRLGYKIQNELFQMFPYYKVNPQGIKSKNYNQKLPVLGIYSGNSSMSDTDYKKYINDAYEKIFFWLAESTNIRPVEGQYTYDHPVQAKWNRNRRYYWLNTMNMVFSGRGTAEFRPHTPTTNPQKMINWLFICNAIVRYAEQNAKRILLSKKKITLAEVLDYYTQFGEDGKFLSEYLKAYFAERRDAFVKDYAKGDYRSDWDMEQDKDYVFKFKSRTHLF